MEINQEQSDITLKEHKRDIEVEEKLSIGNELLPHYVYVSAILLDGKIYMWKVGFVPLELFDLEISNDCPKELDLKHINDMTEYKKAASEEERRMAVFSVPIWVNNLEEHNSAFKKAVDIYKRYPIHEDFIGMKPY